ncbi:aldehyde dehydrogenase family protein [Streptomyces sp. NPDC013157]|uniref:aldehyde dehydrogenase family protein n=1 Tax=Streptomyces sp. NPDC013157 TaxID=3364861 RepID=UPI0036A4EA2F
MISREEGGEVVVGGGKLTGELYDSGYFVEPALFDRVTPGMRIAQEEIFGPVLSVPAYEDEEKAVAVANGTRYGLTATVWTRDMTERGHRRFLRRLQAQRLRLLHGPRLPGGLGPGEASGHQRRLQGHSGGYPHRRRDRRPGRGPRDGRQAPRR